jgi:hypothetical protein
MRRTITRAIAFGVALGLCFAFMLVIAEGSQLAGHAGNHTRELLGVPVMRSNKTVLADGSSSAELVPLPGLALLVMAPAAALLAINLTAAWRRSKRGMETHQRQV